LTTPDDTTLQDLIAIAATVCGASLAWLAVGTNEDRRIRAVFGAPDATWLHSDLPADLTGTEGELVIEDTRERALPASVAGFLEAQSLRFFVAMPCCGNDGHRGALLCVANREPQQLSTERRHLLRHLCKRATAQLPEAMTDRRSPPASGGHAAPREADQRVRERTAELYTLLAWMREEEAQHQRAEESARIRNEQLLRFEDALLRLVTTSSQDLEAKLRQATEEVSRTLDVERTAVWLFDDERTELRCRDVYLRSGDAHERDLAMRAAEFPRYFSELAQRITIAAGDAVNDERTRELVHSFLSKVDVKAMLAVPIRLRGDMVGVLSCGDTRGIREWLPEEQNFASAAAGIVALALEAEERRRAEEQLHALAAHLETVREDERAGLARELHDELGQLLTALRMDVAWFGRAAREHPEKVIARGPERSAAMKELIDEAITTVQRISSDLRPGALHELGLVEALEWQAREFEKRSGIVCTFTAPAAEISPSDRQAVGLYRMMQEALTNVARHAGASRVQCELTVTADRYLLQIQDDGRGLSAEAWTDATSLGLIGMRERALSLGGSVAFRSEAGKGTAIAVTIPIHAPESRS
jgi:signal transduction histidine kinase